ncbi:hypothetical protein AK812_SmicGene30744 [Symbiodinium microadriaticum]|uniref:Uncharacterized protein n=1 Tax=Symbiodinium microadriaticum TaxID=2951 RepID=A0A1Q9CYJ4_SYMMI|nr:hypothetical protein AK812_SmicGene30744 [Symbiodinium microadriaticum]
MPPAAAQADLAHSVPSLMESSQLQKKGCAIQELVLAEVEYKVQEKTEEMWNRGKQVVAQMKQRHQQTVQQHLDEIARLKKSSQDLEEENMRLNQLVHDLATGLTAVGGNYLNGKDLPYGSPDSCASTAVEEPEASKQVEAATPFTPKPRTDPDTPPSALPEEKRGAQVASVLSGAPGIELRMLGAMLRERQLVLLNTWGRAAPSPFGSFHRASEAVRTWFEEQVVKAEQAAAANDLRGVYVLRKLDAFDARSLRGITRSHAHMTHENTAALRRRIGVASPRDALLTLLKSRTQGSSEDASQQWFSQLRTDILESQASSPPASAEIDRSEQAWGVPCDVCGQYFLNNRIMRNKMGEADEVMRASCAREELDLVFGKGKPANSAETEEPAEDRQPKWKKTEGGKGPSRDGWWGGSNKRQWERAATNPAEVKLDPQTQHLVTTLTKAVLRHEADLTMYRADTSFVVFVDTSPHSCLQQIKDAGAVWQDLFSKGEVKRPLKQYLMPGIFKSLKEAMEAVITDDEKIQRCKAAGWMGDGRTALDPVWLSHVWDPQQKKEVLSEMVLPRPHTEILRDLDVLMNHLLQEGVLLRFKSTKDLSLQTEAEVIPFLATISLRTQAAQEAHHILSRLVGCACCKLSGFRIKPERGQRSQMSKLLEQAYKGVDFCEWNQQDRGWSRGSA